ncbi:putative PAS/PAC sensor hybrid histidine kinase [uncultured Desulfobacterium sp.]|uniref:histidine kinase n=1 Tax=uncultured Desulfobacterium sp. TaxID=201089 RepID=A0A445MZJ8_9BACT|nr:putative PAS/PAC sensor hybrid histidine kinase [uncultured Desulfobacterium sp.]
MTETDNLPLFKILVADDEPSTLAMYKGVLSPECIGENGLLELNALETELFGKYTSIFLPPSYELVMCSQADEVVDAVKASLKDNRPFAIAFLDVRMPPGPDGVWAAEHIRKLDKDVEIVIVTAFSDIDSKDISRRVPPAHKLLYIQKPFHPQEIRQFTSALCAKWRLERDLQVYRSNLEKQAQKRTLELSAVNRQLELEIAERRKSEERYRTLVELTSDWIWETDENLVITEADPKVKALLGYDPDEIVGRPLSCLISEDDAERTMVHVTSNRGPFRGFRSSKIHKDGRRLVIETSGMPVWDGSRIVGYRGLDTDVTAKVRAEKERQELEKKLARAEKMEAVGALAAGVAHDLNNIMTGIIGYPDLILKGILKDSPLRDLVTNIKKSGEKAAAIVDDLLTLSRRGVPVNEVVNINAVITEYLDSPECQKLRAFHPGVEVERYLDPLAPSISGSPIHIYKTVMNMVSNAAEAITGSGRVSISTRGRYIGEPLDVDEDMKAGDYSILEITDTGMGIPPEDISKIFEPFYTKKKMGRSGTGLGMAVVWGTVKDHNGHIEVKSIVGKGTTFTLYFPVAGPGASHDRSKA